MFNEIWFYSPGRRLPHPSTTIVKLAHFFGFLLNDRHVVALRFDLRPLSGTICVVR